MKRVLLIEDDRAIQRFLTLILETNGYEVLQAFDGATSIAVLLNQNVDLILLDLGLPDIDGMDVLKEIRDRMATPIIIISARGREQDKIDALDQGANDYITKPFNVGEVLARIRVALRNINEPLPSSITYKCLKIDFERHEVTYLDQDIHLTPIEFKMLALLMTHQGKVLTHGYIQEQVWGYQSMDDYQTLRVFMASIRKKIAVFNKDETYITTEIGIGYRFVDH